jgi:type I restriction enzyme M protein
MTGDDLIEFVDRELFPFLGRFHDRATGPDTIEYKIGEVFTELRNKFRSGYILRDVLEIVDSLRFNTQDARHEFSQLYETRIRRMGNAGRNGGEYYTPRPLIRAMIRVTEPKIGETIYDGAVGSAGFLCEAYDYMRGPDMGAQDYETLQRRTFYGQEKKSLAYIIGIMNMVLHGIEAPNIVHTNSLNENVMDIQEKDRHDIVLANPPFGGGERREVQQNFPIKSGETAYLFLQHFIRKLRAGGRGAIVIKNTFLPTGFLRFHRDRRMPPGRSQGRKRVAKHPEIFRPRRAAWPDCHAQAQGKHRHLPLLRRASEYLFAARGDRGWLPDTL